jgi:hypothetical protein
MNKERYNQIIDEAYDNYRAKVKLSQIPTDLTKEEFVELCKNDITFSVYRGLKLEERELSWEDRRDLLTPNQYDGTELNKYSKEDCGFGYISPFTDKVIHYWLDLHNIPTKLITLTYNNETIESYE